jgi:hypothetical protein
VKRSHSTGIWGTTGNRHKIIILDRYRTSNCNVVSLILLSIDLNYTASTREATIWFVRPRFPRQRSLFSMIQQPTATRSSGPLIIAFLVVILLILHQDNWFWTDGTLVFGFLPIALFWHACISIAATLTWFIATKIAWAEDDSHEHNQGGE